MYRGQIRRRRSLHVRRLAVDIGICFLVLGVIANGIIWLAYRERTYPRTTVLGAAVGNVTFNALPAKITSMNIMPSTLELYKNNVHVSVPTDQLGVRSDTTVKLTGNTSRSWLPIANLFMRHHLTPPVHIESAALQTKAKELSKTFTAQPTNAQLTVDNDRVVVKPATEGYSLDTTALADAIIASLRNGDTKVAVPVTTKPAAIQTSSLQSAADKLNKQLDTSITVRYGSTITKPSRAEALRWYDLKDNTPKINEGNIITYLTDVGLTNNIRLKDGQVAASTIAKALAASKNTDITLTAATTAKTFTYCTAVKGVSTSELPTLRSKAKSTYADPRGWSVNGSVAFKEVTSGCDFTLWLTAANLMPNFGAICDSMWSCRVGPNVVINYDRWQHASPAWNEFGGTLEEYRYMVINHETGHWLGFGHDHCPGSGQLAPVMQQQSINLQGCTFNPWPVTGELARVRQGIGL